MYYLKGTLMKVALPLVLLSFLLAACNDEYNASTEKTKQPSSNNPEKKTPNYLISNQFELNSDYISPNQDARQMILVLHYTALSYMDTLNRFQNPEYGASSHFLIPELPNQGKFVVYRMVPEDKRAWHAGVSFWQGNRNLNAASIGIEIENLGFPSSDESKPLMQRNWYPYASKQQIDVLAEVIKKIVAEYGITPIRIVAHSDIAPGRKFDPGPLFPWEQLYKEHNIGAWYDEETVNFYRTYFPWKNDVGELQRKLARYGYDIIVTGIYDQTTQDVVSAFQMHFYQQKYDGIADIETVARLDALLEKYRGQSRPNL
jgi:N-acetyl-anhydromuramyl-L-alanine amidase AmpD